MWLCVNNQDIKATTTKNRIKRYTERDVNNLGALIQ